MLFRSGGLGVIITVRNLVDGYWNIRGDTGRKEFPPLGILGGQQGAASDGLLRLAGERDFESVNVVRLWVPANSEAMFVTAGGGGWGNPLERDPEKVLWDVIEEYISIGAAHDKYGVILSPDGLQVDWEGTNRLREELRSQKQMEDNLL